jgi:hypothetical protein
MSLAKRISARANEIPFPAVDLFPYTKYRPSIRRILDYSLRDTPFFTMITSRGCAFNCRFCSSSKVHGHNIRYRTVDNTIEEIKYLTEKYHAKLIMFYDDILARAGGLLKMSLEGEGYAPQLVGARRGDSSLLPGSSNTQQERGGGVWEGAGAERQRRAQTKIFVDVTLASKFVSRRLVCWNN